MSDQSRYNVLRETAHAFIKAYGFTSATGSPDMDRLTSLMDPNFKQSWGHNYMIRERPGLQQILDRDGFHKHLSTMVPFLESCEAVIHEVIIDEPASRVVVRNSFFMCPKGQNEGDKEAPENDMIWILIMDETGGRITSAQEFLDATATARIGELIAKAKLRD
ncbi:hypothetical protein SCUP515_07445 [Seiridium cupressi]